MSVIDDYLSAVTLEHKEALERIRGIVHETVPDAEEVISYGMPAFKVGGTYLIGFAAFTDHLGIFPTPGPIEELKDRLGEYKLAKGTIQFTLDKPLPEALIKEIIQCRLNNLTKD
jgi:uncharacterized protein YdhG (YjbR/CyaY superfamily)